MYSLIQTVAYWLVSGFAIIRLLVALSNVVLRPFLQKTTTLFPNIKVSVLIPARNEEANIIVLLHSLSQQTHRHLEIWVLDDGSEDATYSLVKEYSNTHSNIHILRGEPLPGNWYGKNWACHQLSMHADGDYLLFLDADVSLAPEAISRALYKMENQGLHLLSIFPQQILKSFGEKLVVPIMQNILLSLLPLKLVQKSKNPAFAAANGQFMMFRASNYQHHKWHNKAKLVITEDIEILRLMKKEQYPVATLLGNKMVFCQMYKGYGEAIRGFSKNFFALFVYNYVYILLYLFFTLFAYPLLFPPLLNPVYCIPLIIELVLLIVCISGLSGFSIIQQICLRPIQIFICLQLTILSIYKHRTGRNIWKGRRLRSIF